MVPFMMIVVNNAMFNVALPVIRKTFAMKADTTAWLAAAYTLPFMLFMPLFGRLGDALGKKTLFLLGIVIFNAGTILCMAATTIPMVMVGRIIQGIGGGSVHPMCMSIITDHFEPREHGNALGTWNSIGPITGLLGPALGGILIDVFGWRIVYLPILVTGVCTFIVIKLSIVSDREPRTQFSFRSFDWWGVLFLCLMVVSLVFFTSSRPITGVPPFQDWRIGIAAVVTAVLFIGRQLRRDDPFVDLSIFKNRMFTRASLGVSIRMFTMSAINILVPLYLFDILNFKATSTGLILMLHAGFLLITMKIGGTIADRWTMGPAVALGLLTQAIMMVFLGLLPQGIHPSFVFIVVAAHGLGAGFSLASLHKAAMGNTTKEQSASAAGLYSMIRFAGVLFGTALGGVILQTGFDRGLPMLKAYQVSFLVFAGVALIGVILSLGMKKR